MLRIISILTTLFIAAPAMAADRYEFDKSHTNIVFFISHMGYSTMIGTFTQFDGSFSFDPKAPADSKLDVTIKPAGVRTSSAKLDEHLQSKDFFNSEKFPEIRFVSTGITVTGDNTGDVTGNVTMLGVTKPLTMHVRMNKADFNTMTKDFVAGFSAEASLKRSDFGMSQFIPMVGDEVRLMIETEAVNVDLKKTLEKH